MEHHDASIGPAFDKGLVYSPPSVTARYTGWYFEFLQNEVLKKKAKENPSSPSHIAESHSKRVHNIISIR